MIKQRVEKAKQIRNWTETGTENRKGARFHLFTKSGKQEKQYQTTITSSKAVNIPFGDSTIKALVFNVDCKQITGACNCQGNSRNTVCYHGFFALVQKLKTANFQISFYENVLDAVNGLNFGGSLVKVQSVQGKGIVWATVRKVEEVAETLEEKVNGIVKTQEERVNALRGTKEEQNGID